MTPWTPQRYIEALDFAATAHAGQRYSGTSLPYIVHSVTVAMELMGALVVDLEVRDGDLAVLGALLHDVVEDTATTVEEVAASFGHAVAQGVAALSKDPKLPKSERMADSLRRIRACPREIWLVKLADRVANLAPPPPFWTRAKALKYRDEASEIANVLGAASPYLETRIRARIVDYALPEV